MSRKALLIGPILVTACVSLQVPVGMPAEEAQAPEPFVLLPEVARAVLERSNEVRRDAGAMPLAELPALTRAAQSHADEIAERRVLDHRSSVSGRETPADRASAERVNWTSVAENLASMPGPLATVAPRTISLWLDSPGHRRNLLNAEFTHSGVGVARAGDAPRTVYVVQVYATVDTRR